MSKLLFLIFLMSTNNLSADNINFKYPCNYEVKYGLEDGEVLRGGKKNTCIITVVYTFNNKTKINTANIVNAENCSNFKNINITPGNITRIKWTAIEEDVDSVSNLIIELNENKYAYGNKAMSRKDIIEAQKATTTICKAKISHQSASDLVMMSYNVLTKDMKDRGYDLKIIE